MRKLIRTILWETYSPELVQDLCAFHPDLFPEMCKKKKTKDDQ